MTSILRIDRFLVAVPLGTLAPARVSRGPGRASPLPPDKIKRLPQKAPDRGEENLKKSKSTPERAELYGRVDIPEHVGIISAERVIASWLPSPPSRCGHLVAGMEVGYTQPI